jgi:hypothetical protein
MGQKDRRRNTGRSKWKRKKEIKTWDDFWAAEIGNLIQMVFDLNIL